MSNELPVHPWCQKCGEYVVDGKCKCQSELAPAAGSVLKLSDDPKRLLYEVAGYLETLRMDHDRQVRDGSEVAGYLQTADWLLGLRQLSKHCGKISGLTPAQYLNPPNS